MAERLFLRFPSLPSRALGASLVVLGMSAAVGCAPAMPAARLGSPTGYDRLEEPESGPEVLGLRGPTGAEYEAAPSDLDPAEVVPRDLLQGPHHVVRSVRLAHRFLYTYEIDTERGPIEVVGKGLLRKRVIETEILGEAQQGWLNGTRLYAYAVANAVSEPVEGALQIIRHPVHTVSNVPKGAIAAWKALSELKELGRTFREDNYYEEFLGLSGQKRDWAARNGLDPYSANPYVQSWLSRNGLLSLAGDMTVTLATLPVPAGAATIALSALGATSGINEQLIDIAPEDVRVSTRSFLRDDLEMDDDAVDRFTEHPWYSPTHQRTIISALSRMQGTAHRERFIELATEADEAHEAFAFTRLALMFAESHERRAPLEEIFVSHDLLLARTLGGEVVLPLYMDSGYWTAEVDRAEQEITRSVSTGDATPGRVLILSGHLSPRAASELARRGWVIVDGLEELWLSELDLARYQPADPDARRILPRLGR